MSFAIMRCKKLKGMGSVASSLQHCYRERETKNADAEKTPSNQHYVAGNTDEAMGNLRDRLPEKYRKDAVLAVEYMMTASPDWWEKASSQQQAQFFAKSVEWLAEKYGKENVIALAIHKDESTPHLSAYVVPRTADGRLSAKEFIGNRDKMSQDQTDYAAKVQDLGLERGIQGSKAKHVTIQQFYRNVNTIQQDYQDAKTKAAKVDAAENVIRSSEANKRNYLEMEAKLNAALSNANHYKTISHGMIEVLKSNPIERVPSLLDAMDRRLKEMDGQTVKSPAKEQERGR